MFDIGVLELLVIGIVALIVVGPKDLPGMFRTMGRFTGKMRGMAREFSRAMEDAADQAGVKDVAADLKAATNPKKMGLDKLESAAKSFDKWEPGSHTAKLSEERAEQAKKIHEYSKQKAEERQAAEAATDAASEAAAPTESAAATTPETPTAPAEPDKT